MNSDPEKQASQDYELSRNESNTNGRELHKGLEGRHVTMIALGGSLGTGLLIGTYVCCRFFLRSESRPANFPA